MAEYIEREALLSAFVLADCPFTDFEDAFEMVQNAPAADVVPVVRCKDCKYEISTQSIRESTGRHWCQYKLQPCNADDFCSYGEKREEQP